MAALPNMIVDGGGAVLEVTRGGRQNQGISLHFCLLRGPRGDFLKDAVDKFRAFYSVFVYFEGRAGPF